MSRLDGLESCLTLDLVLQTLCQTPPVSPSWDPCRGAGGQPSTKRIYVCGRGGSLLSNTYAKPSEQQTTVTLGVTPVTSGDFLFPCTYCSEVRCAPGTMLQTGPNVHAALVYHAGAIPAPGCVSSQQLPCNPGHRCHLFCDCHYTMLSVYPLRASQRQEQPGSLLCFRCQEPALGSLFLSRPDRFGLPPLTSTPLNVQERLRTTPGTLLL